MAIALTITLYHPCQQSLTICSKLQSPINSQMHLAPVDRNHGIRDLAMLPVTTPWYPVADPVVSKLDRNNPS